MNDDQFGDEIQHTCEPARSMFGERAIDVVFCPACNAAIKAFSEMLKAMPARSVSNRGGR